MDGDRRDGSALPGELPSWRALVESELRNLNYGDADRLGYFQMRTGIWDNGPYAGFPTNPPLQLLWFTDQAQLFGARRAAMGIDNSDPSTWGAWVADVLQPPAQFRGRYQLWLAEAQALILVGCPPPLSPADTVPPPPAPADTVAPRLAFDGTVRLSSHARAVSVRARCVTEACRVDAGESPGSRGANADSNSGARQRSPPRAKPPCCACGFRSPPGVRCAKAIRSGRRSP